MTSEIQRDPGLQIHVTERNKVISKLNFSRGVPELKIKTSLELTSTLFLFLFFWAEGKKMSPILFLIPRQHIFMHSLGYVNFFIQWNYMSFSILYTTWWKHSSFWTVSDLITSSTITCSSSRIYCSAILQYVHYNSSHDCHETWKWKHFIL